MECLYIALIIVILLIIFKREYLSEYFSGYNVTQQLCQTKCSETPSCDVWQFNPVTKQCYIGKLPDNYLLHNGLKLNTNNAPSLPGYRYMSIPDKYIPSANVGGAEKLVDDEIACANLCDSSPNGCDNYWYWPPNRMCSLYKIGTVPNSLISGIKIRTNPSDPNPYILI